MAAPAPMPKAQSNPQRERWAAFFSATLQRSGMSAAEFVRQANHPGITPSLVSQWQGARSGIAAELAFRVARVFDLPATQVLREAGLDVAADYIEDVAGSAGSGAAALEPVIARVRQITDGLTPEQRAALTQEFLDQIGNLFLLTEKKAEILREDDAGPGAS